MFQINFTSSSLHQIIIHENLIILFMSYKRKRNNLSLKQNTIITFLLIFLEFNRKYTEI